MCRKVLNKFTLLLAVCLISLNIFAQNDIFIENKKPGHLNKALSKVDTENITSLTIEGYLNNKDLALISNISNLSVLNVAGVVFLNNDYKPGKREFYKSGLNLKFFPNLKKLIFWSHGGNVISNDYKALYEKKKGSRFSPCSKNIDFSTLPNTLQELHISGDNLVSFCNEAPSGIKINKVVVVDGTRYIPTSHNPYISYKAKNNSNSNNIYIKNLILPHDGYLSEIYKHKERVNPAFIYTEKEKNTYLVKWDQSITQDELLKANKICSFAFQRCGLTDIELSESVRSLPAYCFAECSNLKSVKADGVEYIGKYAFLNTSITNYSFSERIKKFSASAFSGSRVKKVNFHGRFAPEIDDIYDKNKVLDYFLDIEFTVPKGTMEYYSLSFWKDLNVIEEGTKTDYEFIVEQPGTLHRFITDSISKSVKNLTIKGVLYDTDFKSIQKCKNLKSINLKDCFVTISPETKKKEQAKGKAIASLLGFAIDAAKTDLENKYNAGNGSFTDVVSINLFDALFNSSVNESKLNKLADIGIECEMPDYPFEGLNFIEKIVFPDRMKKMHCYFGTLALKEIVLPPCLEILGGHITFGASSLKFPSSLKVLGNKVFSKNENLKIVDLSNTQVEEIGDYCFEDCDNIEMFKGSPVLKKCNIKSKIAYFYTKESYKVYLYYYKEVHIPIGCKSGWQERLKYGELIDDITL